MSNDELADTIAKRFIARHDVKAIQRDNGEYMPAVIKSGGDSIRQKFTRGDIKSHLAGEATFGHYLLNTDNVCKVFAFDIDLEKNNPAKNFTGYLPDRPMPGVNPTDPMPDAKDIDAWLEHCIVPADARQAWLDRKHPGRNWMKSQFMMFAQMFARTIHTELGLPCAVAYTGNKGIHVYAFTGPVSAQDALDGAHLVLEALDCFEPHKGSVFFKHKDQTPTGYPNLSVEVFPKQVSLDGKDLGNLMRLPLGVNRKNPKDPTFFMDMSGPMNALTPVDPMWALGAGAANPWKKQGE